MAVIEVCFIKYFMKGKARKNSLQGVNESQARDNSEGLHDSDHSVIKSTHYQSRALDVKCVLYCIFVRQLRWQYARKMHQCSTYSSWI